MPLTTFLEESGSFINYKGGKQKMSNIVNGYKSSSTFYAFYFKSLLYLNKFSINKTSLSLVKNKRLGSLGMTYDISSFFSLNTRTLSKSGFLTRNIVNNFNNNFYISNVYTAYSASMLKLKKAKVDFFNPNFF